MIFLKELSVRWYCTWKMLAFELVGVFVISTSILNLEVYSVMKTSDAVIFLHKNNKKHHQKNSHVLWIANMLF